MGLVQSDPNSRERKIDGRICPVGCKRGKKFRKNEDICQKECKKSRLNSAVLYSSGKCSYLEQFFRIYKDTAIQSFIWMDSCFILADNYLLTMVYTYFRRAQLAHDQYTRLNFFAALYLAHDMVEDNEDLKMEIFPWIYGTEWKKLVKEFLEARDYFLLRMDFRVAVSKTTCDEVLEMFRSHPITDRVRKPSHSGTIHFEDRVYTKNPTGGVICAFCRKERKESILKKSVVIESWPLDESLGPILLGEKSVMSVSNDVVLTDDLVY